MTVTKYLGLQGTGDWVSGQEPETWRQGVLKLWPNGRAPLTAIMSMMKSEKTKSATYHWWTKVYKRPGGAVTGIYTDSSFSTPYLSGGVIGTTLYLKVPEETVQHFRAGHLALMRDASDYTVDVVGKVTEVVRNGASSRLTVVLREADDNSVSGDLSDCDTIIAFTNSNPQGAAAPTGMFRLPTEYENYCQLFQTPIEVTGSAEVTELRTGNALDEARKDALEQHSVEMEMAFLWGIKTSSVGDNGEPEYTTQGLINGIKQYAPSGNRGDYVADMTSTTWLAGGEDWLDEYLDEIFKYGSDTKLALCGYGALQGLRRLAKDSGQIQLTPRTVEYGMKLMEWITNNGVLYLKTHPLFNLEVTNKYSMVIFEPKNTRYRYMRDTKKDPRAKTRDATDEVWLTEAGMEYHHWEGTGYLDNVGVDAP